MTGNLEQQAYFTKIINTSSYTLEMFWNQSRSLFIWALLSRDLVISSVFFCVIYSRKKVFRDWNIVSVRKSLWLTSLCPGLTVPWRPVPYHIAVITPRRKVIAFSYCSQIFEAKINISDRSSGNNETKTCWRVTAGGHVTVLVWRDGRHFSRQN